MKKNKKHKMSIIELLCIIFIVSLLITMTGFAVTRIIEENRVNSKLVQEELINKACESYINDNNDVVPRAIGDSINVDLKI